MSAGRDKRRDPGGANRFQRWVRLARWPAPVSAANAADDLLGKRPVVGYRSSGDPEERAQRLRVGLHAVSQNLIADPSEPGNLGIIRGQEQRRLEQRQGAD